MPLMFKFFRPKIDNAKNKSWSMKHVLRELQAELGEQGYVIEQGAYKYLANHKGLYTELTLDEIPNAPKGSHVYSIQVGLGRHVEFWDGKDMQELDPYGRYWGLYLERLCGRREYSFKDNQPWEQTDLFKDLQGPARAFLLAMSDLDIACQALIDGKLQTGKYKFDLTPKLPLTRFKHTSIISALALAEVMKNEEWIGEAMGALKKHITEHPEDKKFVVDALVSDVDLKKYQVEL